LYSKNGARFVLTNTSVVFNKTGPGDAAGAIAANDWFVVQSRNSIFANSSARFDCTVAAVESLDYNLFGVLGFPCVPDHLRKPHDRVGVDPKLDLNLANNGGRTLTHKLLLGSPAIDQIPSEACQAISVTTDQRGVTRPQPVGGKCDVGAFELEQQLTPTDTPTPTPTPTSTPTPTPTPTTTPPPLPITNTVKFMATFGDVNTVPDGIQDHYQTYASPVNFVTWAQNAASGSGSWLPPDLSNSDAYSLPLQVANKKFPFVLAGYPRFNPDRVQRAVLRVDLGWPVVSSPRSDTFRFWDEVDATGAYSTALNHGQRVDDLLNKRYPMPGCVYDPGKRNCAEPQWISLEIDLLDGSIRAKRIAEGSGAPIQDYGLICPSADICPAWGTQAYNADRGGPRDVLRLAADGTLYGLLEDDSYLSYVSLEVEAEPAAPPAPLAPIDSFSSSDHPDGALGNAWSGDTSTANYQVANDQLDVGAGGPIYWQGQVFGPDQQASITFVRVDPSNLKQALLLKVQGEDWTGGVIAVSYDSAGRKLSIETYTPGTNWIMLAAFDVTLKDGDRLGGRAEADGTVRAYINDVEIGSANAGAFFEHKGGRIGMWFVNAEETVLDDFLAATVETDAPMHMIFIPVVVRGS
jgi:hypothetical protein